MHAFKKIPINCDLGEGMPNDLAIIPLIDEANIACGFHAGNSLTMRTTIANCQQHQVKIGAHPSYLDRENFGRTDILLSPTEIYQLVYKQIQILQKIAAESGARLNHVKPHGALYNESAKNKIIAQAIAKAVFDLDPNLILFGLSQSHSISQAEAIGLRVAHETFADRAYHEDGSLIPRSHKNAVHEDVNLVAQSFIDLQNGFVKSIQGHKIPLKSDTICIHGDGINALEFAKKIRGLWP
jgi:UPF0271 protein